MQYIVQSINIELRYIYFWSIIPYISKRFSPLGNPDQFYYLCFVKKKKKIYFFSSCLLDSNIDWTV